MAFDWSAYRSLSEWLVTNANSEQLPVPGDAAIRTAVSRAYYSAFHASLDLLVRKGEFTPTGDGSDHGKIVYAFQTHTNAPRKQIGTWLDRLKNRRRLADYEAEATVDLNMAKAALADARRVSEYLATQ